MEKDTRKKTKASSLRHRAEKQMGEAQATTEVYPTYEDTLKLIHELKVHQIELEMQNEELMIARAEIESSLEKYSDLYDFAPAGYFTLTDKGIIREVNLTGAALLAEDRSRLINRRFDLYLSEETKPRFFAFLREVCMGNTNEICEVALSHRKDDPSFIHIEGTAMEGGEGIGRLCRMSVLDITDRKLAEEGLLKAKDFLEKRVMERTADLRNANEQLQLELGERKQAEDALREGEENYRLLFDSITDAVFVHQINADGSLGMFMEVNDVACRSLGYSREELLRMSPDEIEAPSSETGIGFLPVIQDLIFGRNVILEHVYVTKDGRNIPVEINCCKSFLQGRTVVISLVRDITERKRAEEEQHKLRQSLAHVSRMSMIGELTTSLAHEINQPLAAILANAQAARNMVDGGKPDMQELREALEDIINDDKRAGEVIKRVRTQIRKEESKQEQVDINKVIHEAVKLIEREMVLKGILVRMDLVYGLPSVTGDSIQIGQVLINLLMNAIDAMGNDPEAPRIITLHSRIDGGKEVVVSVEDTGKGIDERSLSLLFEPFYTTKAQGMGLGLSISRSIIEAHGGELLAIRNEGGGSTFSFRLPIKRHTAHRRETTPKKPSGFFR